MLAKSLGPAFNRLWSASIASNLADGLLRAAAPLLAARLTQDPVQISVIAALTMLPWLLFAVPIGGLTDRVDRRRLLAAANSVRVGLSVVLAVLILSGTITIYWLFLLTFVFGLTEVVADTAAQTLIPQILEPEQLERGNSRLNIAETVVQDFTGVPLGSLLWGVALYLPFLLSSGAYLIAAAAILLLPAAHAHHWHQTAPVPTGKSFLADLKFGITYLFRQPDLRRIVLTTTSMGLGFSAGFATVVLFILNELHVPENQYGLWLTVTGVGGLVGATLAPRLSAALGRGRAMAIAIGVQCVLTLVQGFAPNIWVFAFAGSVGGFLMSVWNILLMSCYQVLIPKELFGRIHGARRTLVWGMMPFGSLIGGWLAGFGLRTPMLVGGAATLLVALLNLRFISELGQKTANSQVDAA